MILIGTKNFTWVLVCVYLFSFSCFMPITMMLNEYTPGTSTYRNSFPDVLGGTPLYWLTWLMVAAFLSLPFYALDAWEEIYSAPEVF